MPVVLIMSSSSLARCMRPSSGDCPFTMSCGPATRKPVLNGFAQRIAGQLLAHKLAVWLVFIERADHPVAVGPRVDTFAVRFESVRFPKAHKIQPMRRPSLAITRAGQHLVDQLGVRVARGIIDKSIHLFRDGGSPCITRYNRRIMRLSARGLNSTPSPPAELSRRHDRMHKPRRGRPRFS